MEVKPGYKQTEVGVIPDDWDVKPLSDVLQRSRGIRYGIVQPGVFSPRGCLMLRSQDYSKGWADPDEMHRVSRTIETQYRNARIQVNDLIMTVVGAGIGQVEFAPQWLDGAILSRSTARIAIDESCAASKFVAACLQSPVSRRQVSDCQKEGAQPVVSCRDMGKFLIPYPARAEQEAIAEALSDADGLIELLEKLLDKKRKIKQGAMQELLTAKKRLPGFSGEWEVKKLEGIANIRSGGTPSTLQARFWDGNVPWCTPTDITALTGRKYLTSTARRITDQGLKASSAEMIPPGSVIMTSRATIGECAINKVPVSTNQGFKNFIPFDSVDAEFLYYLLITQKQDFISLCGGSTFLEIGKTQLAAFEVRLPSTKSEQSAIASILSDMDAEIAALKSKLAKARQIKQGMMQELLTGRIRLI